jgi:hypothetical protein
MSNLTTVENNHFIQYIYPIVFKITENNLFVSKKKDTMSINVIHHESQSIREHREYSQMYNSNFLKLSDEAKLLMKQRSTLRSESHTLSYESPQKLRVYDKNYLELQPHEFINIPLLTKVTVRINESYSRNETKLLLTALYLH